MFQRENKPLTGNREQAFLRVGAQVGVEFEPSAKMKKAQHLKDAKPLFFMARPERFELPTTWFVAIS